MNKLFFGGILFLLMVIAISCNNDDNLQSTTPTNISEFRFFGVARSGNTLRGTALRENLWSIGTSISIKFLNDPYNKKSKIIEYAKEWEKYANIKFNFIENGDALIRIGFDYNNNRYITWSYIGSDCKSVTDQNQATMSFAYIDDLDDAVLKAEVLRAFGSVLGLELEHRNTNANLNWRGNIKTYWGSIVEDIPWADLEKYVFTPLNNNENLVETKEYDPLSIMVWPFPRTILANSLSNMEISQQDIEYIRKIYPGRISYYNGYQHDLPEPNWEKLKNLDNNLIGVGQDIEGNYYFYPYSSGEIVKYTPSFTEQTLANVTQNFGYRNNPQIVPQEEGLLFMRPTYGSYEKRHIQYINLNNPSNETSFATGPQVGNQSAFTYDYNHSLLYNSEGVFDNSFNFIGKFLIGGKTKKIQQIIYWGNKYKWVMYADEPNTNLHFNIYEQSQISDLLSENNLIASIEIPQLYMSNGGIASVYEYNNKLVIVNFGGSTPISYGNIVILDPTASNKYKVYSHQDAQWTSAQSYSFMCGGIFWKHKLMIYDQSNQKYYFEFPELKD